MIGADLFRLGNVFVANGKQEGRARGTATSVHKMRGKSEMRIAVALLLSACRPIDICVLKSCPSLMQEPRSGSGAKVEFA